MRRNSHRNDLVDGAKILVFAIVFLGLTYTQTKDLKYLLIIGGIISALVIAFFIWRLARRRFYASKKTLEQLRALKPYQFEEFIADLFRRRGYSTKTVGRSHDGGIDVLAYKEGKQNYIQCKKFITRTVRVGDTRDFYGAIVDKLKGGRGFFVTTNYFTQEAIDFCKGKPIVLIDGKELVDKIREMERFGKKR